LSILQPNQVGFSFDTPTNCSLDLLTNQLYTPEQTLSNSQPANTFLNGTFSSLNRTNTANTTETSAMAIWHMLQGFLSAFPQYSPSVNNTQATVGVNLFAESYGGKYAPAFAALWERQNYKRLNGSLSQTGTLAIKLASVGIINGCVDDLIQGPYYAQMANNNTYGLTAINPTRASLANASFYAPSGCQERITQCRAAEISKDPDDSGTIASVNDLCAQAYANCYSNVISPYQDSRRSPYDIAHLLPDSFPPRTYLEYLNLPRVQEAIGTPVNFTETNYQVLSAFQTTGDYERDSLVPALASLIASGIRVAFIYGDRDYICNWLGGEAIAAAVAHDPYIAGTLYPTSFPGAGYAPIIVNETYIGGVVRQYGNLSFSRIYDAGHLVPAYQPETAFTVFARIITGTSISTGDTIDLSSYASEGTMFADHRNTLPQSPPNTCWIRDIPDTCTDDQKNKISNDGGTIINGVLYDDAKQWSSLAVLSTSVAPDTVMTTVMGSVTSTVTMVLTGVYTATATPSPTNGASLRNINRELLIMAGVGSLAFLHNV
jgi:carboxypeptidase C (cathepsin A)